MIVTNKKRPSKTRLSSSVITDYFSVTRTEMAGADTEMTIEELWSWDEQDGEKHLENLCDDSVDEEYLEYLQTQGEVDVSDDCGVASPTTPPQLGTEVTSLRMVGGANLKDVPSPVVGCSSWDEASIPSPPQLVGRVTSPGGVMSMVTSLGMVGGPDKLDAPSPVGGNGGCGEASIPSPPQPVEKVTSPRVESMVTSLRMVGGGQCSDVSNPRLENRACVKGSSPTPPQLEGSSPTPPQLGGIVTSLRVVGGDTNLTSLRVERRVTCPEMIYNRYEEVLHPRVENMDCVEASTPTPPHMVRRVTSLNLEMEDDFLGKMEDDLTIFWGTDSDQDDFDTLVTGLDLDPGYERRVTSLQDQTGQTGGGDSEERDPSHSIPPSCIGGYWFDKVKSTTTTKPVQPGLTEVGEMNILPVVDDDGVGGGRLDTRGT